MPRASYHNYRCLWHFIYERAQFDAFKDRPEIAGLQIEMLLYALDSHDTPRFWIVSKRLIPGSETPVNDIMSSFKFPDHEARSQADTIKHLQTNRHIQAYLSYPFFVHSLDCLTNYLTPETLEQLRQGIVVPEQALELEEKEDKMKAKFAELESQRSTHAIEFKQVPTAAAAVEEEKAAEPEAADPAAEEE